MKEIKDLSDKIYKKIEHLPLQNLLQLLFKNTYTGTNYEMGKVKLYYSVKYDDPYPTRLNLFRYPIMNTTTQLRVTQPNADSVFADYGYIELYYKNKTFHFYEGVWELYVLDHVSIPEFLYEQFSQEWVNNGFQSGIR